ncbi:hypothetical protein HPB58_11815 [Priestia filamentosa]|uniref:hypothetical protein n=1 Tax=Priestia filamentosa TaxID=1402861 RepID=UPI001FB2D0BB|nr:hypothetical protein [Priestia filamentosa]MED3727638.1 hypothetical protein [Priestia filamentosa]UOE62811.1 hypothetical protein HPB58_11815 [Priestia filamentosa]
MIRDWFSDLLFGVAGVNTGSLDTKKINNNIELLRKQGWFKENYDDERYHGLFIGNKHIKSYLQSQNRVKKIINNKSVQKKFLLLLDKQLEI